MEDDPPGCVGRRSSRAVRGASQGVPSLMAWDSEATRESLQLMQEVATALLGEDLAAHAVLHLAPCSAARLPGVYSDGWAESLRLPAQGRSTGTCWT